MYWYSRLGTSMALPFVCFILGLVLIIGRPPIFFIISADLTSSLPALLKVVKLVYSERKQLEKILKSTSIRQQDRVSRLVYIIHVHDASMRQLRATQGITEQTF